MKRVIEINGDDISREVMSEFVYKINDSKIIVVIGNTRKNNIMYIEINY